MSSNEDDPFREGLREQLESEGVLDSDESGDVGTTSSDAEGGGNGSETTVQTSGSDGNDGPSEEEIQAIANPDVDAPGVADQPGETVSDTTSTRDGSGGTTDGTGTSPGETATVPNASDGNQPNGNGGGGDAGGSFDDKVRELSQVDGQLIGSRSDPVGVEAEYQEARDLEQRFIDENPYLNSPGQVRIEEVGDGRIQAFLTPSGVEAVESGRLGEIRSIQADLRDDVAGGSRYFTGDDVVFGFDDGQITASVSQEAEERARRAVDINQGIFTELVKEGNYEAAASLVAGESQMEINGQFVPEEDFGPWGLVGQLDQEADARAAQRATERQREAIQRAEQTADINRELFGQLLEEGNIEGAAGLAAGRAVNIETVPGPFAGAEAPLLDRTTGITPAAEVDRALRADLERVRRQGELIRDLEQQAETGSFTLTVPGTDIALYTLEGQSRELQPVVGDDGQVSFEEEERFGGNLFGGRLDQFADDIARTGGDFLGGIGSDVEITTPGSLFISTVSNQPQGSVTDPEEFLTGAGELPGALLGQTIEGAEFVVGTATGEVDFSALPGAAAGRGAEAINFGINNPSRFLGNLAASVPLTIGAIGGASRLAGPTAGRAVSFAIQPGEELAIAGARAGLFPTRVARRVPGVPNNLEGGTFSAPVSLARVRETASELSTRAPSVRVETDPDAGVLEIDPALQAQIREAAVDAPRNAAAGARDALVGLPGSTATRLRSGAESVQETITPVAQDVAFRSPSVSGEVALQQTFIRGGQFPFSPRADLGRAGARARARGAQVRAGLGDVGEGVGQGVDALIDRTALESMPMRGDVARQQEYTRFAQSPRIDLPDASGLFRGLQRGASNALDDVGEFGAGIAARTPADTGNVALQQSFARQGELPFTPRSDLSRSIDRFARDLRVFGGGVNQRVGEIGQEVALRSPAVTGDVALQQAFTRGAALPQLGGGEAFSNLFGELASAPSRVATRAEQESVAGEFRLAELQNELATQAELEQAAFGTIPGRVAGLRDLTIRFEPGLPRRPVLETEGAIDLGDLRDLFGTGEFEIGAEFLTESDREADADTRPGESESGGGDQAGLLETRSEGESLEAARTGTGTDLFSVGRFVEASTRRAAPLDVLGGATVLPQGEPPAESRLGRFEFDQEVPQEIAPAETTGFDNPVDVLNELGQGFESTFTGRFETELGPEVTSRSEIGLRDIGELTGLGVESSVGIRDRLRIRPELRQQIAERTREIAVGERQRTEVRGEASADTETAIGQELPSLGVGQLGGGGDRDEFLAPGFYAETITAFATGGATNLDEPQRSPSQETLAEQPFAARLTGELPTYEILYGSEETKEDIEAVSDLFGFELGDDNDNDDDPFDFEVTL